MPTEREAERGHGLCPAARCFTRAAIREEAGIPVFSAPDAYIRNYERISRDHLTHLAKTGHNPFMKEDHWREIETSTVGLIRKHVKPGQRVLDAGVGLGRLLGQLPEYDRYGMDVSLPYLMKAADSGIQVCMSRIEDMPYEPEFFDAVVTTDVLEHVLDLNLALQKILSVLKPEGILIVRVPFKEDLTSYLSPGYPYALAHLRTFDLPALRLILEKVFHLTTLESRPAGFLRGRFRFFIPPLPKMRGLVHRAVGVSRLFGEGAHRWVCQRLRHPTEINVVARKSMFLAQPS